MTLIKCSKCGQMVSDRAAKCPKCGHLMTQSGAADPQPESAPLPQEPERPTGRKSRKRAVTWVVALAVLAVLGSGAYFYYAKASAKAEPTVVLTEEFARKIRKYEKLGSFHEGLALAQRNGLWGYIDTEGNEVIPCIYKGTEYGNYAFPFSEGLAAVRTKDGTYGFIDTKGKMVIKPQWEDVGSFSEGVASVYAKGQLNFIDRDGKLIPELSNKYIWDYNANRSLPQFKNGVCEVHVPAKEPSEGYESDLLYVDRQGNQVERPADDPQKKELYVKYYEGDNVGYKDSLGNVIVPARYTTLGPFSCGVAVATLEHGERGRGMEEWYSDDYVGIYGYVDLHGNETFSRQDYERIEAAAVAAKLRQDNEAKERARQEAERQEAEAVKSWIQGNWRGRSPFGETRVGISGDYISVWSNGEHDYTGAYSIEDDHLVYDRRDGSAIYLIIDRSNHRLMLDEQTPMERFDSSSGVDEADAPARSSARDVTFRHATDVMAYLTEHTFSNGRTTVKFDWDGMYTNGYRIPSGAPEVVRFSSDVAYVRINVIPNSVINLTVIPSQGKIVDGAGDTYYVE